MENKESDDDVNFTNRTSSFKEIIMEHVRRLTKLSSCELRGGYYSTFKTKGGEEKEYYVEDSREALENAIYCLSQLLIQRFNGDMKKKFKHFEDTRKKIKQEFLKASSIEEVEVLGEAFYNDDDKILLEQYKIKKLWLYKLLFTDLIKLLAAKNYLEVGEEMF